MTITDNATNSAATEGDSTETPEAGGQTTPPGENEAETPVGEQDDQHADDDAQDDSTRSNREKRYRLRLREAEQQRDELADTLNRTRQAIVASVVAGSGYAPKVAELVAADMDALLTNGLPDPEKIAGALTAVVADFGFARQPRPPQPNHQQGTSSGQPPANPSWAGAIKGE
ncbi:hypothetical protein A5667_00100 [Mycolicibacterium fortuitum]|uniref:hypothetical protein n=1 Tax=Mycolicibacterium fortuitum TaxID=1766 RepID=UPI0007EE1614|nr:hypothetical protein [Mycolicibacterium fortuitum]OBI62935.1 hypothetical protein A5667_00100 [Mycolicibacterium fortuitum]